MSIFINRCCPHSLVCENDTGWYIFCLERWLQDTYKTQKIRNDSALSWMFWCLSHIVISIQKCGFAQTKYVYVGIVCLDKIDCHRPEISRDVTIALENTFVHKNHSLGCALVVWKKFSFVLKNRVNANSDQIHMLLEF